jgi:hypothetical protein
VVEGGRRQNLQRGLQTRRAKRGIAIFLGNQLRRVVRRKFVEEEKVGCGHRIAQQLDALANERSDGEQLFRVLKPACSKNGCRSRLSSSTATRECARR